MLQFGTAPIFANPQLIPGSALATPTGPQRLGIVQDIDVEITQKLVDLYGQNKFPEDTAPSDMKISCKAAFAQLEIEIYNALMLADTIVPGSRIVAPSERHVIGGTAPGGITGTPAIAGEAGTGFAPGDTLRVTGGGGTGAIVTVATVSGPGAILTFNPITAGGTGYTTDATAACAILNSATGVGPVEIDMVASVDGVGGTITVTNGADMIDDLGVQYAGAGYFQPVPATPIAGEYIPGTDGVGTYTFSPADSGIGTVVLISYAYSSDLGQTLEITQHIQGYGPVFEAWLMEPYQGNNGLYLPACRVTKMGKPMKRAGYEISQFEFDAYASPTQVGSNGQPLVARFFQVSS
jgi:hypothetical protein